MATSPSAENGVLVVGAGPTGLMMASQLARNGVPVRVVDKSPTACAESRALGIQSRTLEVFDDLGIIQQALALGLPIHGVTMHADGRPLVHLSFDELDSPYPFMLDLPQNQTERLLGSYLEGLGISVERPVELLGLTQAGGPSRRRCATPMDGRRRPQRPGWSAATARTAPCAMRWASPSRARPIRRAGCWPTCECTGLVPDDELQMFLQPAGALAVFPCAAAGRA